MLPWALSFFVLGVILLGIEVLIPGFGVPGIMGICSLVIASIIIGNAYGSIAVTMVFIIIAILLIIMYKILKKRNIYSKVVLEESCDAQDFDESTISHLMGSIGITVTPLKPYGKVDFDGVIVDVFSEGEYISKNKKVKVINVRGKNVIVRLFDEVQE